MRVKRLMKTIALHATFFLDQIKLGITSSSAFFICKKEDDVY